MRGVFVVALLAHLLCVSSESCENDLAAGIQQDDDASAVELLQVKSTQDSKDSKDAAVHGAEVGAEAKDVSENQWVHYNPPGARGGPGHGYTHHNPPGPRGGPGHGTTHVHHNPAGPRGGPGHGTTVVHHHGWRWCLTVRSTSKRWRLQHSIAILSLARKRQRLRWTAGGFYLLDTW